MNIEEINRLLNGTIKGALAVRGTSWSSIDQLLTTGEFPVYSEGQELSWWPIRENWKKAGYEPPVPFAEEGVFRLVALEDEQLWFRPDRVMEEGATLKGRELRELKKYDPEKLARSWASLRAMRDIWFEHGVDQKTAREGVNAIEKGYPNLNTGKICLDVIENRCGFLMYLGPNAHQKIVMRPDDYFSDKKSVSLNTHSGGSLGSQFIQKIVSLGQGEKEKIKQYLRQNTTFFEIYSLPEQRNSSLTKYVAPYFKNLANL